MKQEMADGTVQLTGADGCVFSFRRLRPGAMLVTVDGYDTGTLGDAPFEILHAEEMNAGRLELFFDARKATGVVTAVREAWTRWFEIHEPRLSRVTVLVVDRLMGSVIGVAKHFSRTGDLIRVMSDAARFDELVAGKPH